MTTPSGSSARQQLWLALALAGVAFGSSLTLAATGFRAKPDPMPAILSGIPGPAMVPPPLPFPGSDDWFVDMLPPVPEGGE